MDKGTDFVNKVAKYLYEKTGVTHHITSPYHPQANGLVERLNRTTTDRLKTLIKEQHDWVECLQTWWLGSIGQVCMHQQITRQ